MVSEILDNLYPELKTLHKAYTQTYTRQMMLQTLLRDWTARAGPLNSLPFKPSTLSSTFLTTQFLVQPPLRPIPQPYPLRRLVLARHGNVCDWGCTAWTTEKLP